jgi:hypothetical protein
MISVSPRLRRGRNLRTTLIKPGHTDRVLPRVGCAEPCKV